MGKQRGGHTRRRVLEMGAAAGIGLAAQWVWTSGKAGAAPPPPPPGPGLINDPRFSVPVIDPVTVPKFAQDLPVPGLGWPLVDLTQANPTTTTLKISAVPLQILPGNTPGLNTGALTTVWAYRGNTGYTTTYLGPTIVSNSHQPVTVTFDYTALSSATRHLLLTGDQSKSVIDKHVHGTDASEPEVRFIAHLHGAAGVAADSDGYAEAWVTPSGVQGTTPTGTRPVTNGGTQTHTYPNQQGAALAWYHDHALGITRLNVYAGGAGGYIVTDANESGLISSGVLPGFGIPLVVQDRMFYPDARLAYPDLSATAAVPPLVDPGCDLWPPADVSTRPEYFGDVIVVNGKAWPKLNVDSGVYRFRFVNGCNSRFLQLSLSPAGSSSAGPRFTILATEGGFLPSAVAGVPELLMGPAERYDVLVDFRGFAGRTLTMINKGTKKPFPKGTPPDKRTDGIVMQFVVSNTPGFVPQPLPAILNPTQPPGALVATATTRVLLYEGRDTFGRIMPLLGKVDAAGMATPLLWDDPVSEQATGVELWEIYNTTADSHPIHIHEVYFSVVNRQGINFDKKLAAMVCNTKLPSFPITLSGGAKVAAAYERGFKDTVIAYPGEVTRIKVDFRDSSPGRFVWHCHILEHEDHEMMRPYDVVT